MHKKHTQAGFGSAVVIGLIAVALLGGGAYYLSTQEQDMQKTDNAMADDASETGTMMKDDPRLDTMDDEALAADGYSGDKFNPDVLPTDPNEPGPNLDGYLLVDDNTEIDGAYLPEVQEGEYVEYSGDLSYAETGDVVLFFHAPWCPSCRGLDSDITANVSAIPDGLSIQKIDYDSATELKKKYGVVRQHTLVQVDEQGNAIKTLTGLTNTLSQVVSQL